jgi:hypothetical protein
MVIHPSIFERLVRPHRNGEKLIELRMALLLRLVLFFLQRRRLVPDLDVFAIDGWSRFPIFRISLLRKDRHFLSHRCYVAVVFPLLLVTERKPLWKAANAFRERVRQLAVPRKYKVRDKIPDVTLAVGLSVQLTDST